MRVALIAAMDPHRVIGRGGTLPWKETEDLRRFRALTMGKPLLMGRRTFESIGKPLAGRRTIVVSRALAPRPGIEVVASLAEGLRLAGDAPEVMVCGGAALYAEALPVADRMYLTCLEECFEGDVRFPEVDWSEWREVAREDVSGARHPHRNVIFERVRRAG